MSQFPFAGSPFPGVPQQPAPFGGFAPQPQGFPPQPQAYPQAAPAFPQPGIPQGFGGFGGPQYAPAPYPQPMPMAPLPQGNLDTFFGQPKTGRAPALSWKGAPDGATVQAIVAEDVTDRDVVADTDPNTRQLRTYNDGSPRYVLVITLLVAPSPTHPEGTASLYARGDVWEKMQAAMAAAGREGAPRRGDKVVITLTGRKPGRGTVPKNVFAVQYVRVDSDGIPTAPAPQAWQQPPAPVPAVAPQAPAQPDPWAAQAAAVQSPDYAALMAQQNAFAQQMAAAQMAAQPVPQQVPPMTPPQLMAPTMAAPVQQGAPLTNPLPGLSAEQQALLESITGGKA